MGATVYDVSSVPNKGMLTQFHAAHPPLTLLSVDAMSTSYLHSYWHSLATQLSWLYLYVSKSFSHKLHPKLTTST